jgi:D-methionine transport system substrate-binding protein
MKRIPKVIQKLGILQGGCSNFLFGASDHCASTRRERRQKICRIANAAKSQLLNHFRYIWFIFLIPMILALAACNNSSKKGGFKVAATPVPHAEILEFAKPDLKAQGIDLEIIVTDDYNIPNRALSNKEVEANFFQHIPFMEEQIKQFHYTIESIAKIEIEPMGIYSKKISSLSDLEIGAVIGIPNDPTNEARALLLLQSEGLIKLDNPRNLTATILNISENPKKLKFIEADAAMLPRSLDDVAIAAINTNYALESGLSPLNDALALESKDSLYANIIAIRSGDEKSPTILALKTAMTSDKMRQFILDKYKGAVLPAF